ncbi:hypothetical protein Y013_16930 [Rhodococcus pyridinivorans SB3094]|uniref:Uncharacterized protein n=1 Tax=Rhodococcus pyridinivorans SB3094 TaxID=1435356 RepID=V9XR36_9NOCA|nr:hypothetical protein Y013_16930 [Rhodococcus pyridinivorans SB3094]
MHVMDDVEDLRPAHVFVLPGGRPVGTTADFLTCTLSGKPTPCPGDDHAS